MGAVADDRGDHVQAEGCGVPHQLAQVDVVLRVLFDEELSDVVDAVDQDDARTYLGDAAQVPAPVEQVRL